MRIIFLDVDGVLNFTGTKEMCDGFLGVDDRLLTNLKKLIDISNETEETKIVLSSSWRIGEDKNGNKIPTHYEYLLKRLGDYNLSIYDETPYCKGSDGRWQTRGKEIITWLYKHKNLDITGYVVLDDWEFADFKKYKITKRFIRTTPYGGNGGLREKHIKKALEKLEIPYDKNKLGVKEKIEENIKRYDE